MNLQKIYEYRFRKVDQNVRQAAWKAIAPKIHSLMGSPKRVLDPCAGRCEFLNSLPLCERSAVDLEDHALYRDQAIKMVFGNIFDVKLAENSFDGVFVSNFLEHLANPEQISEFLGKMKTVLAPGGVIAVMGPNFKYCASEYFDCADHVLALTEVSVEEHLIGAGYEIVRTIPRFLPYSFRGYLPPSPALIGLYLSLPMFWPLLGKQFLILAKKV